MIPHHERDDAEPPRAADAHPGADELLDPMGINMALITDAILAREWEPDGYTEANGCRIYKYKALGSATPRAPRSRLDDC